MPGVRGAQSKTAQQRALDGSRTRPRHYEQPTSPEGEPPQPPDLTELEATHWIAMVAVLRDRGQLTADLGEWLRTVVQAWATWMMWAEQVKKLPLLYDKVTTDPAGQRCVEPKVHPAHVQVRLARKAYVEVLKEGGLTPASVVRVKLTGGKPEAVDPFAAFQQRGGIRAVK